MRKKWLYTLVLLMAGAIGLQAQERAEKQDTVSIRPKPFPATVKPLFTDPWQPYFQFPAPEIPESKEQRAARVNQETFHRVMTSVRHNLSWFQPPTRQFLSGPYSFQQGTVPVMSASNPFIFARKPGGEPIVHPYSPEAFPQCIRMEYDFKSGTYKQVMVPWNEFENNMARSFNSPYRLDPVPRMRFHSTDYLAP